MRYITINMTVKKFYIKVYRLWSLDINGYIAIKIGYVHIYIEISS